MSDSSIDINVIAENLVELLTNSVNMTSVFYDIFLNPQPMDVILYQYNDENQLEPIPIPNRAKDRIIAKEGVGTPEGHVEGTVGTAYVDTQNSVVYFKVSGDDQFGWAAVLNREGVLPIVSTYCTNRGFINIDSVRTYLNNNEYVTRNDEATTDTPGVVQLDGASIKTNSDGVIQAEGVVDTNTSVLETYKVKKIWTGDEDTYTAVSFTPQPNTLYFLSDTGKIFLGQTEIAAMAFPSGNATSIPLGSAGEHYTMPFNGVLHAEGQATAAGQYIEILKLIGYDNLMYRVSASVSNDIVCLNVPVLKGEEVMIDSTLGNNISVSIYECKAV